MFTNLDRLSAAVAQGINWQYSLEQYQRERLRRAQGQRTRTRSPCSSKEGGRAPGMTRRRRREEDRSEPVGKVRRADSVPAINGSRCYNCMRRGTSRRGIIDDWMERMRRKNERLGNGTWEVEREVRGWSSPAAAIRPEDVTIQLGCS